MTEPSIRAAFPSWPKNNDRLRAAVASMSEEHLAIKPGADRWPLWASIGHLACQRVFWLCVFAGEPGAEATRFTDSGNNCPGDDDLETVLGPAELVEAIDSTFRIVERCLDTWTPAMLGEVIRHPEWGEGWTKTRGWALERVLSHDLWHMAELNEALGRAGLAQIDPWG